MAYTVDQFVQAASVDKQQQHQASTFELPQGNEKMLQVNFGVPDPATGKPLSMMWVRTGAMVAYTGDVSLVREGILSHGIKHALKKVLTCEGATLTKATSKGEAHLYLAEQGKIVTIFKLQGDSITVNGKDLLAFEPTVTHKIVMLKKVSAIISAGLFSVKLTGHGFVAVMTQGKPICLRVAQGMPPVFTDPDATVAWSGDLSPEFKADIQVKTFLGRGSGDSFQMKFDGNRGPSGMVLVQPFDSQSGCH